MPQTTIVSLAVLKVNWDRDQRDYLENFVPMLAECIRASGMDVISAPELQKEMKERFGLAIPLHGVNSLLVRLKRRNYVTLEAHVYKAKPSKLAELKFADVQQRVLTSHRTLIAALVGFVEKQFQVVWTDEQAEQALQAYLRDNAITILSGTMQRSVVPDPKDSRKRDSYLIANFVQEMKNSGGEAWQQFEL